MKKQLEQIRSILNVIEEESAPKQELKNGADFSAYELPRVIQEIVDDLQPLLSPYEAAFYWYAFRHSIARNGDPHVRLSIRAMRRGVVKSSYSQAVQNSISQQKLQEIYRALESIGAVRKVGEPNREGTLYHVFTPDEIDACRQF
ncbi:MAG: hypothetical protein WCD34_07690, partial [Candidatus Acidiferrum sp.]